MAEFTTLLKDLALVESPRWHDDRLVFSDWAAGEVLSVDLNGARDLVTRIDAMPFCLDRLPDGRLLIVAGQQLLARESDGTLATYAELGAVSTKPWNDIVTDGRGTVTAVFLGRRKIVGLSPGRRVLLSGLTVRDGRRMLLYNPVYELL